MQRLMAGMGWHTEAEVWMVGTGIGWRSEERFGWWAWGGHGRVVDSGHGEGMGGRTEGEVWMVGTGMGRCAEAEEWMAGMSTGIGGCWVAQSVECGCQLGLIHRCYWV